MALEILECREDGYHPLVHYQGWRVAIANYDEKWKEGNVTFVERHLLTDEVFVPLQGASALYVGEDRALHPMEPGKVYNVQKGTWHNLCMEKGAKVLIVENDDTSRANSEYCDF